MLPTLDLLVTLLKCSALLTLARLLSTAFGWEFGISRHYLQLLEWIFQVNQQRIEKVNSKQRLQLLNGRQAVPPGQLDVVGERDDGDEDDETNSKCYGQCGTGNGGPKLAGEEWQGEEEAEWDLMIEETGAGLRGPSRGARARPRREKIGRVSTPDGPPVFLLDDYDQSQSEQHEFHLLDASFLVVKGLSAIIDDQVTKRFTPEQLKTWNLLTRTNAKNYQFMSRSLGLCWLIGFIIRYALLLPLRIIFTLTGFLWLVSTMTLIGFLPCFLRDQPHRLMSLMSFRMLACGITSRLKFHNHHYKAKQGDICVANHTSPIDVVLLACDNCYALVGQRHGGLLGWLEVALSRATNHVWFDRAEMRDRQLVTKRLREHVSTKGNLPVLIFPEGTCINNSAVMMFRKGSFETTDRVCPVAIKYDPRFGDPFWNSSKQSYVQYLLLMMSSWAIKCDVWYMPPMERLPGESSAEFANRVKAEIAKQGGLVDLNWDGQLKRSSVKPTWLYQQQEDYAKRLRIE